MQSPPSLPSGSGIVDRSSHTPRPAPAAAGSPTPSGKSSVRRTALASIALLVVAAVVVAVVLALKHFVAESAAAGNAGHGEPPEFVESAVARTQSFARATTAIGTVRALQSINLQNELAGTVRSVGLKTSQVVEAGAVLVELDVAVEQAEQLSLEAEARLAESMLKRMEQAEKNQGASAADVDRARAEHDKTIANVERIKALIERKRIRAPFRARVGMVDLHVGQYLEPGTILTTLQGVDEAVHIDFAVTQEAATRLAVGNDIEVTSGEQVAKATIVAMDARVESSTRNMWIRALLSGTKPLPAPGASVRVRVPVEVAHEVVVVPVSALRRGPSGDHVFVLEKAADGALRSKARHVTSGAPLGDDIVIAKGLAVGERVATTGSFKLREGALIHDTSATPTKQ